MTEGERQASIRDVWRAVVPHAWRERLRELRHRRRRRVRLGDLRRTTPIELHLGRTRGGPIDRHYIEAFLDAHRGDIRGRVLEVLDPGYTERFGSGVEHVDILDIDPTNRRATITADVTDLAPVADETFDCILLTQVLQLVWDVQSAMNALARVLAPGGVLLATLPGIVRNAPGKCDWWRFTSWSARRLAEDAFGAGAVEVETYGNVLAVTGFLYGLGRDDFDAKTLAVNDPRYEFVVAIRAVKQPHQDR